MFWISRGVKKWFQWRKALIGGDCSGMLRFCAPLGTPAINLHTIAYKSLKTKRGKKARSGNSRQHDWKKQYSPYPRKKDATNQNTAIQIDLPCRPPLFSPCLKFGVSFTTDASGFPPPTARLARRTSQINCQTVCLSFDHTAGRI